CNGARMEGDTLVARCRTADGREQRTALAQVRRCAGDVGNNNGILQCTLQGGGQAFGQVVGEPGRGAPPYGAPPAGYGDRRYGEPGYGDRRYGEPGYGDRRYGEQGYGSDRGERCRG